MSERRINKFLFIAFLLVSAHVFGQGGEKEKLQKRKVELQDEIQLANKILKDTRKNREVTVVQVQTLKQKVELREKLMRIIDSEIRIIDREISKQEDLIAQQKKEIEILKEKYAETIRTAYKSKKKSNRLMFVLSSESLTQAIKRMEYLRQYSEYRKQQVAEIEKRQLELEEQIVRLNKQKDQKQSLRTQKDKERQEFLEEKQEQENAIAGLKGRESQLTAEIRNKEKEKEKINKEIQRLIELEIKRAREAAERKKLEDEATSLGLVDGKDFSKKTSNAKLKDLITAKRKAMNKPATTATTSSSSDEYALTPDAARLAKNFEANQGKLPWPVERGVTVKNYGKIKIPGTEVFQNNTGIDIATEEGAEVRACFEGTVTSVIRIPESGRAIIIQHGSFYTVYMNIVDVYVKIGDKVTVKQSLGKILTDPSKGQTIIHFELWKGKDHQDPAKWLLRR